LEYGPRHVTQILDHVIRNYSLVAQQATEKFLETIGVMFPLSSIDTIGIFIPLIDTDMCLEAVVFHIPDAHRCEAYC